MSQAFIDWSDRKLSDAIRDKGTGIDPAYNDLLREMERRAANRQARASLVLSVLGLTIAVAATVVTALKS